MAAIVPIKKFRPSNSRHNNGKSFTFFVNFSLLYAVRGSSLRLPRRTPAGSLYTILINNIMKIIVLREIFSTVGPSSSSREPANQRKTTENGPRILCQSSARVTINQTFTQEGVPTPKREPGSTDVVTVASKMRKKNMKLKLLQEDRPSPLSSSSHTYRTLRIVGQRWPKVKKSSLQVLSSDSPKF